MKAYEIPELEVTDIDSEDVIVTSNHNPYSKSNNEMDIYNNNDLPGGNGG